MKRGDLFVGGEFAHRLGKYGQPRRCIVLDVEPVFDTSSSRFPWLSHNPTDDELDRSLRYWRVRRLRITTQRVLVAVEVPVFVEVESDDDPHVVRGGRPLRRRVPAGTRWFAHAPRGAEIVSTWADELARRAALAEQEAIARRAREIAEQQRLAEQRRRDAEYAERERQRKIEREQERKREAIRAERFEQRIEPVLRELGFAPERVAGTERLTLTLEEAERLSAMLGRDVSAEP